jgi:protein-L-isoaspartate(D-aspartate) O-methyltransferase
MRSARERMVAREIAARGVHDERVLQAMRTVPREDFVPERRRQSAYEDHPLPIGHSQTISQPFIVALMAEAARIGPDDVVLEIGTGSGYGAAVLSHLAREVHTVERIPELAESASVHLQGYSNVEVHTGDGTLGWPAAAPYDAIVVTAAAETVPSQLTEQLAEGARLVIPVGEHSGTQKLLRIERRGADLTTADLGAVAFVPLIGDT